MCAMREDKCDKGGTVNRSIYKWSAMTAAAIVFTFALLVYADFEFDSDDVGANDFLAY